MYQCITPLTMPPSGWHVCILTWSSRTQCPNRSRAETSDASTSTANLPCSVQPSTTNPNLCVRSAKRLPHSPDIYSVYRPHRAQKGLEICGRAMAFCNLFFNLDTQRVHVGMCIYAKIKASYGTPEKTNLLHYCFGICISYSSPSDARGVQARRSYHRRQHVQHRYAKD
jgi:hypothetical protein